MTQTNHKNERLLRLKIKQKELQELIDERVLSSCKDITELEYEIKRIDKMLKKKPQKGSKKSKKLEIPNVPKPKNLS